MRRFLGIIGVLLLLAGGAWAASGQTPYTGSASGGGFVLTVVDTDIDQTWEVLSGDATHTPMASDTTISVGYAYQTHYDSLANGGATVAVFTLGSTADASGNDNLLSEGGTPGVVDAIFSTGYSSVVGSYYYIDDGDGDFNLGTAPWTIAVWSKGWTSTNPSATAPIFSAGSSPDLVKLEFSTAGRVVGTVTDDAEATTDVVTSTTDLYDADWHLITLRTDGTTLTLNVDGTDDATDALDEAAGSVDPDSITIGGLRKVSGLVGFMDDLYYIAGRELPAAMSAYIYKRGMLADTAYVKITGISDSDSTYIRGQSLTPSLATAAATTSTFHAFEAAWGDTAESQPLIVYTTGSSPRSALLDSIPASLRDHPIAHRFFGKSDTPVLQRVIFTNRGANAISYELRAYSDNMRSSLGYASNYSILASCYIASGGSPVEFSFGEEGISLGAETFIAAMGKGDAANADGAVTFIGKRRTRR